jgi:hypothetical protein
MLSLPYIFVLISIIDSLQVRLLYGLGALSHSRCSPMMLSYILTGIVQSCPNTRCCHFWPLRTRYIAKGQRHLSTGRLWTSPRNATLCATSCAGSTRRQAERRATSGSTSSWSGPRPSCYAAGRAPNVKSTRTARLGMALFVAAMTRAAEDCPSSGHQRAITYVCCHRFPFFENDPLIKHIN